MKKAIAILLVLLVAGVMFGADDSPGTAQLDITAAMGNKANHGFLDSNAASEIDSFGDVINTTYDTATATDLVLDSEALPNQSVGSYVFATNANVDYAVSFTLNPLVDSSTRPTWYVPYSLKATYAAGLNVPTDTDVTFDFGETTAASTRAISATTPKNLISLGSGDTDFVKAAKWGVYTLVVNFDGAGNEDAGLPVGKYSGSVVASIVVK
jgi:hypothetical protein